VSDGGQETTRQLVGLSVSCVSFIAFTLFVG